MFHITMATNLQPFSSPNYPSISLFLQSCYSFFLFLLLLLLHCPISETNPLNPHSLTFPRISYSEHCNHIVPESPVDPSSPAFKYPTSLTFDVSFFSGGDSFFNTDESRKISIKSAMFLPTSIHKTLGDGKIYKVDARLTLKLTRVLAPSYYGGGGFGQNKLQVTQIDGQRIPVSSLRGPRFDLSGFWSESTGQVCMVGSSRRGTDKFFDARLMLNYSMDSNIYGSLVKGVLESLSSDKNNQSYFETISILGARYIPLNYEYKLLEQSKSDCGINVQESLSVESVSGGLCKVFGAGNHVFSLMYRTDCGSDHSCSPFGNDLAYTPYFMSLLSILCDGERMRILFSFRNSSSFRGTFPFDPSTTLIAEGAWDVEKNRFCGVACRILNFSDSLSNAVIDDCSLRFSLSFPAVLSIRSMAHVVGQLWSVKPESDPGYFKRIEFSSLNYPVWRFPSARYQYTETERVSKLCGARKSRSKSKGKHYPDAKTSDMRFVMSVKYTGEGNALGSARAFPYFVGDWLYRDLLVPGKRDVLTGTTIKTNHVINSFTNITYGIRFLDLGFRPNTSISRGNIYAEGTYDMDTGELCMVGCQTVRSKTTSGVQNQTKDCSLAIKFKFSPIDSKSDDRLKGTIESTRNKTDPLYIGRIEVSSRSIYARQAKESVWRMDLEIVMVLISNTLSCVFVGMQLYHMKQHQETLPFISIAMMILLTLGHIIPLLLNFEELFKSSKHQQSLFFDNDKWLEAKQIVVRIVTMIAVLLECRLLQLAWTARNNEEHHRNRTWTAEKKVFYVCLPLYITGGLIAWFVNQTRPSKRTVYFGKPRSRHLLYRSVNFKRSIQQPSIWKDMKSYGGLMLDGFLLPQILFNTFSNSDTNTLAASFYAGNSIVRLLPHVYDLYRSYSYGKILDWSFIYANHRMDYYSTAWDIVILCIGLLFAVVIFLQQRFGGRCFLRTRFKQNGEYQKVVELQEVGEQQNSNVILDTI